MAASKICRSKKWFDESLRDHGWIEGNNLIIDYRYFEGHAERIPALAAELGTLQSTGMRLGTRSFKLKNQLETAAG